MKKLPVSRSLNMITLVAAIRQAVLVS